MNFQQLKIIREAARQDYNLTEVANMLYTSQSGVSRRHPGTGRGAVD